MRILHPGSKAQYDGLLGSFKVFMRALGGLQRDMNPYPMYEVLESSVGPRPLSKSPTYALCLPCGRGGSQTQLGACVKQGCPLGVATAACFRFITRGTWTPFRKTQTKNNSSLA